MTGKQPRAVRREISFLLEEETWCLLRKAAVGWAAHTKEAAAQQGRQDYLLTFQNVCNETAKCIPSPAAVHETRGWSRSRGCGWQGAGVIEASASAPACSPARDADPARQR